MSDNGDENEIEGLDPNNIILGRSRRTRNVNPFIDLSSVASSEEEVVLKKDLKHNGTRLDPFGSSLESSGDSDDDFENDEYKAAKRNERDRDSICTENGDSCTDMEAGSGCNDECEEASRASTIPEWDKRFKDAGNNDEEASAASDKEPRQENEADDDEDKSWTPSDEDSDDDDDNMGVGDVGANGSAERARAGNRAGTPVLASEINPTRRPGAIVHPQLRGQLTMDHAVNFMERKNS